MTRSLLCSSLEHAPSRWAALAMAAAFLGLCSVPRAALACGCFAQTDPSVPVVQAGERIAFAQRGNQVEMHVQVRWAGEPEEFGWLLPVPEDPELSLGSDAFFQGLVASTQPRFLLNQQTEDGCSFPTESGGFACADGDDSAAFGSGGGDRFDPTGAVIRQERVGPYDATILDASNREEMLAWLDVNEMFVEDDPSRSALEPYLGAGRRFLALKLAPDSVRGDIQPIVLRFEAAAPSIPIQLTRVGAEPDMPVLVWVFGPHRAIPRNYRHTLVNLEHLNWFAPGSNYNQLVTRAVDEAPDAHAFVTEFAGSTQTINESWRRPVSMAGPDDFDDVDSARRLVEGLEARNFDLNDPVLLAILRRHVPYPRELFDRGITADAFYSGLGTQVYAADPIEVNGSAAGTEIWTRIVEPERNAAGLVTDFPVVTRMYTTMSPFEMTEDPMFGFNPDLPWIDNERAATMTFVCNDAGEVDRSGWLELPDGRRFFTSNGLWSARPRPGVPFSRQIQALGLEGAPRIERDNTDLLSPSDPPSAGPLNEGGCRATSASSLLGWLLIFGAAALGRRVGRRQNASPKYG